MTEVTRKHAENGFRRFIEYLITRNRGNLGLDENEKENFYGTYVSFCKSDDSDFMSIYNFNKECKRVGIVKKEKMDRNSERIKREWDTGDHVLLRALDVLDKKVDTGMLLLNLNGKKYILKVQLSELLIGTSDQSGEPN